MPVSDELYSAGSATCNQTLKVVEDATDEGTHSHVVRDSINTNSMVVDHYILNAITQQQYQCKHVKSFVVKMVFKMLVRTLHTL